MAYKPIAFQKHWSGSRIVMIIIMMKKADVNHIILLEYPVKFVHFFFTFKHHIGHVLGDLF